MEGSKKRQLSRVASFLVLLAGCALFFSCVASDLGAAPENPKELEDAIWQYKHENFEEALAILKKLRTDVPTSSMVAYYLGITCKQLQDYKEARVHLEACLTLEPKIKLAFPELIDVLYQLDDTEGAKHWLEAAEKEAASPAQLAFLKGLIFLKEGKAEQARSALEEARRLDESLAQPVQYYQALALLQTRKLSEARDVFQRIVSFDPQSDLASFANEYVDSIKKREEADKPFRASISYALQYDTNLVLKPSDSNIATGGGPSGDWRQAPTFQAEYNYKVNDRIVIKPGYSCYYAKQMDLGFYDLLSNDISVQPTYLGDKFSTSFPTHFNHVTVNDKAYLVLAGTGNVTNFVISKRHMAQLSFQYSRKLYQWQPVLADENRDSNEYQTAFGWFYFFTKDQQGFLNLRYALGYDDTKGNNWRMLGNRFTVTASIPVAKKIQFNTSFDYYPQKFVKMNSVYNKDRFDSMFTFSNLLSIEIIKNVELQLQYMYINNLSSLGVYKYVRNLYSFAVKYRF